MAWEKKLLDEPGAFAGEDMSAAASSPLTGYGATGQFLLVKQHPDRTASKLVHCNSVKDRPRGIAQTNPKNGGALEVMVFGYSKLVAGATVYPGDNIGTDSAGRGVRKNETSTGADYGSWVIGECVVGAAVGELMTVKLGTPYRI